MALFIFSVFQLLFFSLWAFEVGPVAAWGLAAVFAPSMLYMAFWGACVALSMWVTTKGEAFLAKYADMADRGSRIGK